MSNNKRIPNKSDNTVLSTVIDQFRPAVRSAHSFLSDLDKQSCKEPFIIATSRPDGSTTRFETYICTANKEWLTRSLRYIERTLKFLLWSHGAGKVNLGGSPELAGLIKAIYDINGQRKFDISFMSRVYKTPFQIISCPIEEVPGNISSNQFIGPQLDGFRVGFDLGASDLKVSAVAEGKSIFSTEIEWNPRDATDPNYHKQHIYNAIKLASSKLPRLDAIGGSSAGVYINNQPRIASLFRAIPEDKFDQIEKMFEDLGQAFGVPFVVINDGEVTALAGAISLEENGVMGLAMGSSQAIGFIDSEGKITGHLNELAFAPIDVSATAPIDEWSGDKGVGASYLSQQAAFRLAKLAGIAIDPNLSNAGQLAFLQELLEGGDEKVIQIWEIIGMYLGYAIAHYADFYDFKHLLVLGRVTSGTGGQILINSAKRVLSQEFPKLLEKINVQLPDEKSRRVGQSIAAASLPIIKR